MIECSICNTKNNHLATICPNCGGFLQTKVDNINLFETMWQLIESPVKAFKNIAISKHKNYIQLMGVLSGIDLSFLLISYLNLSNKMENPFSILIYGTVCGCLFGVLLISILSISVISIVKFLKANTSFKNIWSVISFSFLPFVFSLILIPLRLSTFGASYYGSNPSPTLINPFVYYLYFIIEALLIAWFVILFIIGIKTVYDFKLGKTLLVATPVLLFIFVAFYFSKYLMYG
jgi:hypothetical protein